MPHTPIFPHFVKRDGPDCEIAKLFGAQKEELAATRPDLIVMFDTDHLNTFFLNDLPIFAVGIDKSFKAPNDEPRDVPNYVVKSLPALAAHIRAAAVGAGYDVGMTQNFSVDHSITVPLHFLTPEMQIPVIPFFVSGHLPPLAVRATLSRPRQSGRPRYRSRGRSRCASSSWAPAASRSKSAGRAWRRAAPTACPIRTGRCA